MKPIDNSITILSLIHTNVLSIYLFLPLFDGEFYHYDESSDFTLDLKVENLTCNPSWQLTSCVLSELLSWVSS